MSAAPSPRSALGKARRSAATCSSTARVSPGLLITQALKTPYVSFTENLFNDAAVAMPTPIGDTVPSQTVSTAMKNGWTWKIPLTGALRQRLRLQHAVLHPG